MTRPHSRKTIQPFPEEIDREHFASWLSGFVDGEGFFRLSFFRHRNWTPAIEFQIAMRADDNAILFTIQSFFQCGFVKFRERVCKDRNASPGAVFQVRRVSDLAEKIVPHFIEYPLLAKKARDFAVWREGVILASQVMMTPKSAQGYKGTKTRWVGAPIDRYRQLVESLRSLRKYAGFTPLSYEEPCEQFPLFDQLLED